MAFNTVDVGLSNTAALDNFAVEFESVVHETWRNMPALAQMSLPAIYHKPMANRGASFQMMQFGDLPDALKAYVGGNDLLGQNFAFDHVTITRDNYIIACQALKYDDLVTENFDAIAPMARAQTRKVTMELDLRFFITLALAGRAAAKNSVATGLNFHNGGNRVTQVAASVAAAFPLNATGAANYRERIRTLGRSMDEDAIPRENRLAFHTPYMAEVLAFDATGQVFSSDFMEMGTTGGDVHRRRYYLVDGFKLFEPVNTTTNLGSMPDQNITAEPSKFNANFTPQAGTGTPVFIAFADGPSGEAAVAVGEWTGVTPFMVDIPQNFCKLFGVYALAGIGQGTNPSCAGTIEVATS